MVLFFSLDLFLKTQLLPMGISKAKFINDAEIVLCHKNDLYNLDRTSNIISC